MKSRFVVIASLFLAVTGLAATPAIIPLPVQLQVLSGNFTLCPPQPNPAVPGHALTKILVDSSQLQNGQYLAALLGKSTGYQFQIATVTNTNAVKGAILLTTNGALGTLGAEGYELTVSPDSVLIRAPAGAGVFYGIQSLLQLLPPQILSLHPVSGVAWTAPCVYVQDQPRFSWRGYMMDEARHFFGKAEVKKMMDAMALQKMNTFHWHLVDDTGWRIEILSYPNLTVKGAFRPGWTNSQNNGIDWGNNPQVSPNTNSAGYYGGFYTQAEVREIVAYAAQRYITIVPEIEMPAHSSAALASYPQFGCGNPVTDYRIDINSQVNVNYAKSLFSLGTNITIPFLQTVLTEVMGLFPGQYIHCGGDEVAATGDRQWTTYSVDANQIAALGITGTASAKIIAYQHWFSTNMAAFVKNSGRTMIGWSEFEAGGTVTNAALMDWQVGASSFAGITASNGQKVVMAPDTMCYLNYYSTTNKVTASDFYPIGQPYFNLAGYLPLTKIYSFDPMPTNLAAQYQSNILGAEGAEWAEYIPSTANIEFKAFPRLCAMAELTWTPNAQKDFTNFTTRLNTHVQRLAAMGMNYDHTNSIAVTNWGPAVSTTQFTMGFDVTPYVTGSGDINLDFHYTSGTNAMNIYSLNLLANGTVIDSANGYVGFAGANGKVGASAGNLSYFVLHNPSYRPGTTYTVEAMVSGYQGTNVSGTIYFVNWN